MPPPSRARFESATPSRTPGSSDGAAIARPETFDSPGIDGRGLGTILALSTIVTAIIALPVVFHPQTVIFGVETVGRHYDPFVVMQQFAQGGARGIARQPLVDDLGAWLAKGVGPVAAYNVIVLASFPAAAAATYALARFLTGVHRSSLVAALAFAFAPVHVAHAAYHPHIAQVQWIPLYLLALFAAVDRPSAGRLAWLGAAVAALALSNFYGALIGALITPPALVAYWCSMPSARRTWRSLVAPSLLLVGLCLSTYTVLRISYPSFLSEAWQARNPLGDLVRYSARWEAYILPPVDHAVTGSISRRIWNAMGVDAGLVEQQLSLGVGLLGLALLALWRSIRDRSSRAGRTVFVLAVIAGWACVLSLMPAVDLDGGFGSALRASLQELLPMFRAYARLGIVVALAVAIVAGIAVDDLLTRAQSGSVTTRRVALAATACLLGMAILEFSPIPWRTRDVLPTRAHRWLAEQGATVRALDCTRFSFAEQSVPWLLGSHAIGFLRPPFEDCDDPLLVDSMMADGSTHLIVRTVEGRDTSGVIDAAHRFMLVRNYADSRVYRAPSGVPVVTGNVDGFYTWEREPEFRRWMGQQGQWQVRNLTGQPLRATLHVELNAFEHTRTLDVRLADVSIQLTVEPDRIAYAIGPFPLPPGDSEIAFRSLEPATRPHDTERSDDSRPLTIMFGAWNWTTDVGSDVRGPS